MGPAIAAYISGHGFGHATRSAEVLRVARATEPELSFHVVSSAPEWLFAGVLGPAGSYRHLACDVGLVQRGALDIDLAGTVAAWQVFEAGWPALVESEADWLSRERICAVWGDVPPLAFAAAARAGIPSMALANFSWDWIYRHYVGGEPGLGVAADLCAEAYASCGRLLRLPFAGDLSAFPVQESIALVARRPGVERTEARQRLGIGDHRRAVLLSFGGLGLSNFDASVLKNTPDCDFLVSELSGSAPANVQLLDGERMAALGLNYVDLVGAVDAVISKPGYGIVSDCMAARTRLAYTERGDFPEYPILVREMAAWLPAEFLAREDLREGRVAPTLERLAARPWAAPPPLDGAQQAARRLIELV